MPQPIMLPRKPLATPEGTQKRNAGLGFVRLHVHLERVLARKAAQTSRDKTRVAPAGWIPWRRGWRLALIPQARRVDIARTLPRRRMVEIEGFAKLEVKDVRAGIAVPRIRRGEED